MRNDQRISSRLQQEHGVADLPGELRRWRIRSAGILCHQRVPQGIGDRLIDIFRGHVEVASQAQFHLALEQPAQLGVTLFDQLGMVRVALAGVRSANDMSSRFGCGLARHGERSVPGQAIRRHIPRSDADGCQSRHTIFPLPAWAAYRRAIRSSAFKRQHHIQSSHNSGYER